ncbi:arsenical resistance protein ArsH [Sphaeroforma arctica JP610]|uniref:Arsenical resistance protein ArsH n=1 Tax=Sphaeroforma arctica JP610 TaxID=667725 RepID=A0A0L0FY19_9EUKA|nr:arsenical resistance protein ArsH [Sphaeroforma arctica JP610]KNC81717.1 arsenical resistance protein ArsH [Sphaeroforma arctica JP610]|eukprot:XP_014155619.1 arsenical resistance protein ArsH [Sphaeroforma arctica JP610]
MLGNCSRVVSRTAFNYRTSFTHRSLQYPLTSTIYTLSGVHQNTLSPTSKHLGYSNKHVDTFLGLNQPRIIRSMTTDTETVDVPLQVAGEYGYSKTVNPETHVGGWLAFRGDPNVPASGPGNNWTDEVEVDQAMEFRPNGAIIEHKPRILVLYGSLRESSFSRKCAYETARLLERMDCDVRVFNPSGLPVRDPTLEELPKVLELRALTQWSEGHIWVSPEMHGTITGVFKNQIDWIPLNTGSVRPTQGRTTAVFQVNGGSQSFNAVNELRKLSRWMRMPCTTNQSSVAKAWQEFDSDGRMKPSGFRERVVDVCEEFVKFTRIMREQVGLLNNRHSERKETLEKGRLLTQEEKEKEKAEAEKLKLLSQVSAMNQE